MNKNYKIIFRHLVIVVLIVFSLPTHGQTISTYTGGGISDGIVAANANIYYPTGIAFDSFHNMYIMEAGDKRIRKVDHITGIIMTVAGNGAQGFSGDNGLATDAAFFDPRAMALDGADNLYIPDVNGGRIRRVDHATGIVTTIVGSFSGYSGDGGPAKSAKISNVATILFDVLGDLYIADTGNNRIRKVDHTTGIITTIAGNGSDGTDGVTGDNGPAASAALAGPSGIIFDESGNLYIAEINRNTVRKIDHVTGIITTVAGIGTIGYSGDNGQATAAQLYRPYGLAIDNSGNLYIADTFNNVIRKVDFSTGIITTVAGIGPYGFSGDNGQATAAKLSGPYNISFDDSGNLLIADSDNNRIRKVDPITGVITTIAGNGFGGYSGDNGQRSNAQLNTPSSVAVDASGDVFIGDFDNNRIRKIDRATGLVTTLAGDGINNSSGDNGPSTSAQLANPWGLAVDESDNLYFSDPYNCRVRRINKVTGVITTIAGNGIGFSGDNGPATSAVLNFPSGIAIDGTDQLYVADTWNNRIRKVDLSTGIISTVAGNGTAGFSGDNGPATAAALNNPSDVALDNAGNLFIADAKNRRVRKMDLVTGIITTIAGTGVAGSSGDNGQATNAELVNPAAVTFDNSGNLFITDSDDSRIRKIDLSTGVISTVAGGNFGGFSGDNGPATAAALYEPYDVAFDSNNVMFIADRFNNRIRKVNVAQSITFDTLPAKTYGDEPFDLVATSNSGLPISFSSSYPTVATVSGNQVTIVAAGSAIITASQAGDDTFNAASVTQTLCVSPSKPTIIVNLSNPATPVLTSSANTGNQWFLNGTAISGATNPTFTTSESGQYTVQVSNACGVNPTSDPVSIAVAGLEVPVMSGTYPNPAAEAIFYRTPELNEPVSIQIVTVLGQVIKQKEFSFGGELRIELDGLTTGNYIFRATQGHQLQTAHFFKK